VNFNLTAIPVNVTTVPPWQRTEVTTEFLQQLCGLMDQQAFYAAIAGFVLTILAIVYFGRIRRKLEQSSKPWIVPLLDKLFLTLIGLTFAFIIGRMMRGS